MEHLLSVVTKVLKCPSLKKIFWKSKYVAEREFLPLNIKRDKFTCDECLLILSKSKIEIK